ncbi:MAG: hypothetical protein WD530_00380, partial [Vicingaceae bacterium]
MQSPKCIFCSSNEVSFQFPIEDQFGDGYAGYRCQKCSTFFLYPQPSNRQLAKAYDDSYYGEGERKFNPIV